MRAALQPRFAQQEKYAKYSKVLVRSCASTNNHDTSHPLSRTTLIRLILLGRRTTRHHVRSLKITTLPQPLILLATLILHFSTSFPQFLSETKCECSIAFLILTGVDAIQKVGTRNGRYLYTADGSKFYITGVVYQEQGEGT